MELAERVKRGRRAILLAERNGLNTAQWRGHLSQLLDIITSGGRLKPTYGKEDSSISSGTLVDKAA